MKKLFIIEYDFLNVRCTFETEHLCKFLEKLEWIDEQAEILNHTVEVRTEKK